MKNRILCAAVVGVACMALSMGQAQASLIGPHDGEGVNDSVAFFIDEFENPDIKLLDKDEFNDGIPDGFISDLPLLVQGYNDGTLDTAEVSWNLWDDLSGMPLGEAWAVALKFGNRGDGVKWIWWEVSDDQRISSDGWQEISTGGGAISHISIYGIPDASTLFLLGSACLIGFGVSRKRSTK